ncbi:type II toxin-antitoxin system ParD family antitoxin [[Limnothrix rosea] IAM M-220]|uniref:type II toxin-antitoxin system ParD family antitoxin n=1 Tax=[Limnothrix rosea] IAM M-220 TaxID=454133 RepID=UPI00095ABD69|nr:type II toxin-antitoxin system ParD family antitoxin [[Limnothrix rosea] IAM M-220]OKH17578.1 CopG family transcriptional regulator [[Limnothrix rosea] IAM M-220]
MSLSLTHETEQRITQYLTNGQYHSADDVVLAGLQLLEQRQQRLNELREEIQIGVDQVEAGQVMDGETVFDRLFERLQGQ